MVKNLKHLLLILPQDIFLKISLGLQLAENHFSDVTGILLKTNSVKGVLHINQAPHLEVESLDLYLNLLVQIWNGTFHAELYNVNIVLDAGL
jgi:hypothetical protein